MQRKKQQTIDSTLIYDLRQLLSYMSSRHQHQLGLLIILMLIASLSEIVSLGAVLPFLGALSNAEGLLISPRIKPFILLFKVDTAFQLVLLLALIFIAAVIISNGLRLVTINVQTRLAANISSSISCRLYRNTLLQPYSFHMQHNSSDLINSVTGDTQKLTTTILIPLLTLITNSFIVLGLICGLFLINWYAALISTLIFGGAYIFLYRLRSKLLKRNSQILVQSNQQQIKVVQEGLGGIRDIIVNGTQDFFQSAYQEADLPHRHAVASSVVISQTPRYMIEVLAMTAIALLALILGYKGDFNQTVPVLGSLALGANRLLPALQQAFAALAKIQSVRASLKRILQGLQRPVDPLQLWIPNQKLSLNKELRFENVWFHYETQSDWVLRDLNLTIMAKTTVGLVGSTGSGKSTTADLILGLLKAQKGRILIDGQSLEGERLRQWQKSIAHVPQSIFLADTTIAENIAFGISKEKIDIARVYEAARLAQIDEFIKELPAQYKTYVGERGVRLSGGQRQRIGIARALYRQASVIVFDEATSALDNSTEKEVMAAINSLSHQLTIILIAHRLSTLEKCDQVIKIQQGHVFSQGSYQELIDDSTISQQMGSIRKS